MFTAMNAALKNIFCLLLLAIAHRGLAQEIIQPIAPRPGARLELPSLKPARLAYIRGYYINGFYYNITGCFVPPPLITIIEGESIALRDYLFSEATWQKQNPPPFYPTLLQGRYAFH